MMETISERNQLLASIAETISDYRDGELAKPTPEHVDRWIKQFAEDVQVPLLHEVDHVLRKTYFSRDFVAQFLEKQVSSEIPSGKDPRGFWRDANFLKIQQNGHSQEEMLQLLGGILHSRFWLRIEACGSNGGPYIYLDDVIFSGFRVGDDLSAWVAKTAPSNATVHVLVIATHTLGEWQALDRLSKEAATSRKKIAFDCRREMSFENRKYKRDVSEVLWPAFLPDDASLHAYIAEMKFPFQHRQPGGTLEHNIFSSEEGRQLLEREFLLAGVRIRSLSQNTTSRWPPLGFSYFGLGFGSMIVTYRNCPNNCPLAFWWGAPEAPASSSLGWYPLFQRKTY